MDQSCVFCFEPLLDDLASLECGHVFHSVCVTKGLLHKKQCPTCRHPSKRCQKLFFDLRTISKEMFKEEEDSRAVQRSKELEVELASVRAENEALKVDVENAIKVQTRLQDEVHALGEFRNASTGKELQLRRELKAALELNQDLEAKLASKTRTCTQLDILLDNIRGENRILRAHTAKMEAKLEDVSKRELKAVIKPAVSHAPASSRDNHLPPPQLQRVKRRAVPAVAVAPPPLLLSMTPMERFLHQQHNRQQELDGLSSHRKQSKLDEYF